MGKAPNVKVEFSEIECIKHLKPVRDALFVFGVKMETANHYRFKIGQ
nr:hypothetical protein [Mucilaginibacter sp. X5P1]